jgi:hypothetical protein
VEKALVVWQGEEERGYVLSSLFWGSLCKHLLVAELVEKKKEDSYGVHSTVNQSGGEKLLSYLSVYRDISVCLQRYLCEGERDPVPFETKSCCLHLLQLCHGAPREG